MFVHHNWTAVQRVFAFAVPIGVAAWLVTVPAFIGASNFLASFALFTALTWVVYTTYRNAMPASSLAQALHDADHSGSPEGHP